ncbi:amidase [Rhizobium sp. P38BS-XIX]|uniref:amidase n=1 Tax=Rhizobium sp. P38BS-XIX TaxID=2726740 RepID=UPI001457216F|nr:amidase [Rhizobium sp. P38BS-XIX]NLR99871.1 amidase [Rhizobium sp. P38BS-XIX]
MSANLEFHDITEISELIGRRALSSREVTEMLLERIECVDGSLRSYACVLANDALRQAEKADREIESGLHRGPLHGVPVAVKDLCWIEGLATPAGSTVHRHFVPPRDATVVRRLTETGAVLIGKTQLTEGAYSDYHPSIPPVTNPWNSDYWAGISSSGSAVAVAAGLCFGSIASDTGGSIRWPAAANGVTGLKPTWGRVSRQGIFDLAPSLDHIGPIARNVADVAAILAAIAGHDIDDPTTSIRATADYKADTIAAVSGKRIGIDRRWNGEDVDPETQAALVEAYAVFSELGVEIVDVSFPDVSQIIADWTPNCAVEAAVAHRMAYAEHGDQYGPILSSVIEAGKMISGTAYQEILLRRAAFRGRVEALLLSVDAILTPVHPFAPLSIETIATLGEQPDLIAKLQRYTCPFNMSGHPTLTFPAGVAANGMPIGLQLIAVEFDESSLFSLGAAFQRATTWHRRHPHVESSSDR